MKKPFTLFSKLLALVCSLSFTAQAQTNYSTVPLTASSFTADVIANGTAANPAASSTTADVDGAFYYLISQDYYTATTAHTSGLPNSGLIPNSITGLSALTYQLASYSANNAMQVRTAGGTGAITFATPTAASELYVLGISGSGASTVTMTVNYSDNTNTVFTGQTYPDWFTVSATQNVFGSSARASTTVPVSATAAANTAPFLSQVKLTIPAAKAGTTVTGISFTTATGSGVLNIMAVSAGVPAPNCAAAPTSLTTVASTTASGGTALAAACVSTSIYLSVGGVPANAGYTYQWQSSTTSATTGFANISGATSSTYTATGQTATTYYRVLVGCQFAGTGSTPTASTAVQVTQNAPTSCYCTPTYASGGTTDIITRVRLGALDNSSTGNAAPYYRDYSAQQTGSAATLSIPTITQGGTATVTLNFGNEPSQYSAVWIDFNLNGIFEASEFFSLNTSAGANGQAVILVAIPATATLGQTKMRVRGGDDNAITSSQACGASSSAYGEAEDYLVNIATTVSCTPTTATFSYPAASYCVNGTTAPTATLASGATAGTYSSATGLTLNATTGAITLSSSTPGTYTVTNTVAATATNCASLATATVTVAAAPATPTLTSSGTAATGITLTSSAATGNQFYRNNVLIPGATGTSYLINSGSNNGSYTVTVTNAAGCSATSAAVNVAVTAAAPAQASTTLTVSPNPTHDGLVALELSGFREAVTLTVTNALGQRVAESTVASTALGQKQTLNLSALPAGVYVLQARTASGAVEVRRIVRE
jgi:hypothetical protein